VFKGLEKLNSILGFTPLVVDTNEVFWEKLLAA
jgi:hypothetical protein